ncbi:Ribosomal protein L9/RNase H1, N-terminal [Sesbania bispinosa]|nr:Ribosomal protein L9/RNase H1, N-terminal [Sesbania bispinosa]
MAFRRHDQRKKTYVVFRGRQPGIYSSWVECHQQVNGFTGCLFRSYSSLEEAETGWLRYWGMLYVGDVAPLAHDDNPVAEEVDEAPVEMVRVEGGIVRHPKRSTC